jgi:hypothetical protein
MTTNGYAPADVVQSPSRDAAKPRNGVAYYQDGARWDRLGARCGPGRYISWEERVPLLIGFKRSGASPHQV